MFLLELSNRFETLQSKLEPDTDVENMWEKLKSQHREVADEKLVY